MKRTLECNDCNAHVTLECHCAETSTARNAPQEDVAHQRTASADNTLLEALKQLVTATWDGNLMSKDARDRLVKCGLAQRVHGYNWLTNKGIEYLVDLGALVP